MKHFSENSARNKSWTSIDLWLARNQDFSPSSFFCVSIRAMHMCAIFSLGLSLSFVNVSRAQVQLQNGLIAGTVVDPSAERGVSPFHYFAATPSLVVGLKEWRSSLLHRRALEMASQFYDNLIITVRPSAILKGELNPNLTSFADAEQIRTLNELLRKTIQPLPDCATLPFIFAKDERRKNILLVFVFSTDGSSEVTEEMMKSCLNAAFELDIGE